jgi:hypothetical protein
MTILTAEVSIEQLAGGELPNVGNIDGYHLDRIVALARLLSQNLARERGDLGTDLRPFGELDEQTRDRMRGAVVRVLQALVLLGWLEAPG